MLKQHSFTRNDTVELAKRVRKNLDFIIEKRADGAEVHEVTQLVTSLLGLIVFPWEDKALKHLEGLHLSGLEKEGWPRWDISLDETKHGTKTLRELMRHLRNAASHQRVKFSSDDPEMEKVIIQFKDAPQKNGRVNWRAKINAADLKKFCVLFTERLESLVD